MMVKKNCKSILLLMLIVTLIVSIFNVGTVLADSNDFKLTNVVIKDKSEGVKASIDNFDKDDIKTNTVFYKINDYVIYNLTIKNNTSKNLTIKTITDNNSSSFVEYHYDNHANEAFKSNSTIDIPLTIIYKKSISKVTEKNQNDSVKLTIVFADENGNEINEDININPKTNDSILIYGAMFIVSLTGIIIIVSKNKKASKVLLLILALPLMVKAISANFTAILKNEVDLEDKMFITYNVNGVETTKVIGYDTKLEKPEDPIKDGYTFKGWYKNGELFDFNQNITGDFKLEAKYDLVDYNISYDLDGGTATNPTKYTVESKDIILNNPTKDGYTFAGWTGSNGTELQTRVTIEKGSTGDKSYTAHFTKDEDVSYKVIHKYKKLNGSYDEETENLKGAANTTVTPAAKSKTGFNNPTLKELTIKADGSSVLEYIYERINYTFTVNSDVETTFTESEYPYETEITVKAKDKEGYTFGKWNNDNTNKEYTFKISENTSLEPIYQVNSYTVTFDSQGGSSVNSITGDYNTSIGSLTNSVRDGYTFAGWYTEKTSGTKIEPSTKITKDVTYYAHWNINSYTVTFNSQGGTSVKDVTVDYNNEIGTLPSTSKEGYTFAGWYTDAEEGTKVETSTKVTKDVTYYAHWNINSYTVTFNSQGGTNVDSIDVEYNKEIGTLPSTTKEGYTFAGWYTDAEEGTKIDSTTKITKDTTFYAHWNINSYTVSFNTNGGSSVEDITVEYNKEVGTLPTTSKEGYTFAGWYTKAEDGEKVESTTKITKGTTLYAHWNVNSYTVSFDSQGGSAVDNITGDYDTEIGTLPNATKEGYTFDGWYTEIDGGTKINSSTKIKYSITYYAHWNVNSYTVSFDSKGGTNVADMTVEYNKEVGTLPTTTKEGYTFAGWYTEAEEGTKITTTTKIKADVTYYAHWNINTYTVTFDSQEGTEVDSIEVEYNKEIGTLPVSTRTGFKFNGWFKEGGDKVDETTKITSDITLYAHWIEKSDDLVCKLATSLHTEECVRTDNKGCYASGYRIDGSKGTTIISYGNIAATNDYTAGDAYDCDVNGDGVYDPDTERFYYVTNNGDNEVLVYYSNFEGEDGPKNENIFTYDLALTKLPSTTQWSNLSVTFGNDRAARFITGTEMEEVCTIPITSTGSADTCIYFVENTKYADENQGRTGTWLQKEGNTLRRLHSTGRNVTTVESSSNNGVRPVIEVPTEKVEKNNKELEKITISFDSNGGDAVESIEVVKGTNIGNLPIPIREDYIFEGWYEDSEFNNKVENSTVVNEDTTLIAKWTARDEVAKIGDKYYTSIQSAMNAVPITGEKTTVKLLKDLALTSTINLTGTDFEKKNIVFDLNGHTLSNDTTNVIKTKSTIQITNGTITSKAGSGAIDIESDGKLIMNDGKIIATGSRQAIYNNGGTVEIGGTVYLSSAAAEAKRGTVHNVSGTLTITGGTIISTSINAVKVDAGTVVIGSEDGVYDKTTPVIEGESYGVSTAVNISIYDGILKGKTAAINNEASITGTEAGSEKINNIEGSFKTLYYNLGSSEYKITLDANEGVLLVPYKTINIGDPVGELPIPFKGVYTFKGWYTELDGGEKITEETIPTKSTTYYAHWEYESSDEIVDFDMTNDAMKVYYQNIDTWKNDQDTFQTNMDANMTNYNCSLCTGPSYQDCPTPAAGKTLCDQPNGYSTGVTSELTVYESDNTKKTDGAQATYTTSKNGIIYNMIPGQIYYWESAEDANVHGYVKASSERRIISSNVRNVRDLGGFEVDTNNDGTIDGTVKYGKLFRGAKLSSSSSDVAELTKLGITEEVDLRGSSTDAKISNYQGRSIQNYLIYKETYSTNYAEFRQALVDTMQDVIDGQNIYFHCKIGTDRTGTMAYFLEGLLGVNEEDRVQDYELSYFYGLLNRHRFHDYLSGSSINPRFTTMHTTYASNEDIYNWFMAGTTNKAADDKLISDFRNAMINYNS